MESERIGEFLNLAGKKLELGTYGLRVGIPDVRLLRPCVSLYSRIVTIKSFMELEAFMEAARRQLERMGATGELKLGERRTLGIKDKQVVGFEVSATELNAESSLKLQESGIGGRRHMGCGMFVRVWTTQR